jgi:hypothetical protein
MKPYDLGWLNHDQEEILANLGQSRTLVCEGYCLCCPYYSLNVLLLGLGLVRSAACVSALRCPNIVCLHVVWCLMTLSHHLLSNLFC